MKIAWLSDIHLNFLDKDLRLKFHRTIVNADVELIIISGDIAEANSVSGMLIEMYDVINKPIYFVLGNHDYYGGQVHEVREEMTRLTHTEPFLYWLQVLKPTLLKKGIYLLGQDGWADGRFGDYYQSPVEMNDSRLIVDLFAQNCLGKKELLAKMQQLADADAFQLKEKLLSAIAMDAQQVLIVTHIPPFKENCFYRGQASNKDFLPYYASQATGNVLLAVASEYSQVNFLVLCGHTHATSLYQPLPNLLVKSAQAEYYHPDIQEIINL
jgi:Icc-related predicted phosphoesterase